MELLVVAKDARPEEVDGRIRLACFLGHKEILIVFTSHDKRDIEMIKTLGGGVVAGLLVKDQNQARQLRRSYGAILAPARRDLVECKSVTHILNPEEQGRPDFIHHRNSGLNQVLLKFCRSHGKEIVTTLAILQKEPHIILGRMMQNARWCRKYKVPYHITSGARTLWEQRDADGLKALERELRSRR